MNNKPFKVFLIFLLLGIPFAMFAQKTISGTVSDEKGETIPGANVMIKGTATGTTTDYDGRYSLQAKPNDILEFSFLGYETETIKVGNQTTVNAVLKETAIQIKELEVVAVGYGNVKRKDLTGSIAKANMSDILKTPINNVAQALGGRIAGVQVSSTDGSLGENFSITIRGAGSLTQSTEPLYVIDGFPLESSNMGSLNPKDIASIDVLKDASATAIYGSRGANGVVIINTKSGRAGKPRIEYSGSFSVNDIIKKESLLSGYQFVELQQELMNKDEFDKIYLHNRDNIESYRNEGTYDWQDAVYRQAFTQNHYLSLSGQQGDLKYTTSGSYVDQDGIIINSNLEKYQGRVSLDQKMYDNKLRVRLISNVARTVRNGVDPTGGTTSASNALMYSVWGYRPVSPTGADLMNELFDDSIDMTEDYRFNPIFTARNEYRKTTTDNFSVNAMAEYTFIKNLRFRATGSYQLVSYIPERFNNSKTQTGFYHDKNSRYKGVNAYLKDIRTQRYLNENTLTYQFRKKGHSVNMLGGVTFQKEKSFMHDMESTYIANEIFEMAGFGKGKAVSIVSALKPENTRLSYLTRVNYNYRSKYYLTASFRADASSKFAPENRWGYFPSGSVAWAFSREDFLKHNDYLSNGKLRLSYGQTGNDRVDDYAFRGKLYTDENIFYAFESVRNPAYIPSSMQNYNLKWETTEQLNAGLDLGFFDSRVNLTFEYYLKKTKDLLLDADLAPSSGYLSTMMNIGQIENRGLEFSIETQNIRNDVFSWTTSFNVSFNHNKITKLNGDQIAMTNSVYWDYKYRTTPAYISAIGRSAGLMYGYLYEGTYKNEDFDVTVGNNGVKKYTPKEGVVTLGKETQPGDPRYRDINKDGVINDKDKTVIGRGHPIAIGGLGNTFTYKDFDMSMFFQFSYGNDILNANRMLFENPGGKRHLNMFSEYANRWTESNPQSDIPRARATGSNEYSSLYIEDGSFIRFKSLSLGYNLPTPLANYLHLAAVRISLSAENLFTITSYSGNDPEVSTRHTVLTPGFDWSPYPRSRSFSASLNVTF